METKICAFCLKPKPASEFIARVTKRPTRNCDACREYSRRSRQRHLDEARANYLKRRNAKLKEVTPEGTKRCPRCMHTLPIEAFGYNRFGEICTHCTNCRAYNSQWAKLWRATVPYEKREAFRHQSREYARKARDLVLDHYGRRCACCGETETCFLSIEHINGGGHQQRKLLKGNMALWIVKHDFPSEFEVLCMNCQWGRRLNGGVCPHQKDKSLSPSLN